MKDKLTELAQAHGFTQAAFIRYADAPKLRNSPPYEYAFDPKTLAILIYPVNEEAEFGAEQAAVKDSYFFTSNKAHHALNGWINAARELGIECAKARGISEKASAAAAGLGVIRRNTIMYTEEYGSGVSIQTAVLSAEVDGKPLQFSVYSESSCEDCAACVDACPTGALIGDGNIIKESCIRFHQMKPLAVPALFREHMTALVGCDVCQAVCPANQNRRVKVSYAECRAFDIESLLEASGDTISALAELIGTNLAKRDRVQAQAALIAGNTGCEKYLDSLQKLSESPNEVVREHAAWAIDKIASRCSPSA
ncbi:MAG: 4Fe-4S binding protein [Oscillospiraceae bacterium]|jgi:ferredoxin|nr:4Fe-4S binding protein [Oscillospiraceae bacterium]